MLIEKIYKKHYLWVSMVKKMGAGEFSEDIIQEVYIRLLRWPPKEKNILINGEVYEGYMYLIIRNTYIIFLNKRKLKTVYIEDYFNVDNNENESIDEIINLAYKDNTEELQASEIINDLIDQEAEKWHWYEKKLFNIYRDNKTSIRKISKKTNISYMSIFFTLKNCKRRIKENVKEHYQDYKNKDYELLNNMQTYFFYIKDDKTKEPINIIRAETKEEAIKIFCLQKKLEQKEFLKIFDVENS